MGQKFALYDGQGIITGYYDSIDSPVPAGVENVLAITDEQWQECINTQGYKIVRGALVAPSATQVAAYAAAITWAAFQAKAQAALDKSDITILRCAENSVAVPPAWVAYRKSLRAILGASSGDATQAFPTQPSYPAGT